MKKSCSGLRRPGSIRVFETPRRSRALCGRGRSFPAAPSGLPARPFSVYANVPASPTLITICFSAVTTCLSPALHQSREHATPISRHRNPTRALRRELHRNPGCLRSGKRRSGWFRCRWTGSTGNAGCDSPAGGLRTGTRSDGGSARRRSVRAVVHHENDERKTDQRQAQHCRNGLAIALEFFAVFNGGRVTVAVATSGGSSAMKS